MKVIGPNNNSIFFPAVGYRYFSSHHAVGESGYYRTSTPLETGFYGAYHLWFYLDRNDHNIERYRVHWATYDHGFQVRPVSE